MVKLSVVRVHGIKTLSASHELERIRTITCDAIQNSTNISSQMKLDKRWYQHLALGVVVVTWSFSEPNAHTWYYLTSKGLNRNHPLSSNSKLLLTILFRLLIMLMGMFFMSTCFITNFSIVSICPFEARTKAASRTSKLSITKYPSLFVKLLLILANSPTSGTDLQVSWTNSVQSCKKLYSCWYKVWGQIFLPVLDKSESIQIFVPTL